ncbi:MAG: hypothetical protein P4L88_04990 [Rhodoferax sp.]|nr:hypothetical protein [Rhodoferax sp.]
MAPITNLTVSSTSAAVQGSVPITFGQPFKAGDVPAGTQLDASDSIGRSVPLQMDEVSSYADGSVRFAVLSAQLRDLQPNENRQINIYRATTSNFTVPKGSFGTRAFNLKIAVTIFSPQISVITFGNRHGTTPGKPYLAGEKIVIQLGNADPEQYVLTVTDAEAGGGFMTLTKIAEAFLRLINNSSKIFHAYKIGAGGGYENLWITTQKPDDAAFDIKFLYSGAAVQTISQEQNYKLPRTYQANPSKVLESMLTSHQSPRLGGPIAYEYTVVAPFVDTSTGNKHPQLTARLHTRFLDAGQRVRTDMVIENDWTYEPNPGNITYDLTVTQDGRIIYHNDPFTHTHHARWHKVLWSGPEPQVQVKHNMRYFLDTKTTWNYDLSVRIPESVLAAEAAKLANADTGPMGSALITHYFPGVGARDDIGPLPRWTALYLLSQDSRQRAMMLANADAAASVPIHYRDKATDQPVSIDDHPGLTLLFGASIAHDATPVITNGATIWSPDTNHQASFAYIPYMVTGDAFYLDELLFWANWNMASKNPDYREKAKGLIHSEEVRGQAWGLRSLGEATRALPDRHPMKRYFNTKLINNLDWYNGTYPPRHPNDMALSSLGMVERGGTQLNQTRPWMNDYMAIVLAQLAENGELGAQRYLQYLSKFTVGRFTHDNEGFCSAYAAAYTLKLFDDRGNQITDWRELFQKNFGNVTQCDTSQPVIGGYPDLALGYAASARAMLAASARLGIAGAAAAYEKWRARTPKMDNAFKTDPTWAIVP